MKKNKLIVLNDDKKEEYNVLLKVDIDEVYYIIYTDNKKNDVGEILAYAASYEFKDGHQLLKPVDDEATLEFLDSILLQTQNRMNKDGEISE